MKQGGLREKGRDERYRALIAVLKEARIAADLSQEALAGALDRHQQFVSKVETGERRLDAVELVDYAAALGLEATKLIGDIAPR